MASHQDSALSEHPLPMPDDLSHTASPPADIDGQSTASDGTVDTCRICRGEATDDQPLFYPCKCSGSIRYVHQECLMEWLSHSKKKYCELCKTPFRFTKLYDQSMPATLPWPLFARQLGLHILTTAAKWARYTFVAVVWSVALPWCIRQVWRGLFWLADGSWLPESQRRMRSMNETMEVQETTLPAASLPAEGSENSVMSLLTSFLHFLAGESLGAKILRILFSVPPVQLGPANPERAPKRQRLANTPRHPSLLSDVKLIKTWTSSNLANNISIDVMEGLLICLGLVASFILVFLIREWVINQQPMLNNPDPDNADNAAAGDDRAQRAIRRARRRRAGIRAAEPAAAVPPVEDPPGRLPHLPRRRAMTDDNIGAPLTRDNGRPELPVRAQSLVDPLHTWSQVVDDMPAETAPENDLPPPLLRGMVGNAVDARRVFEERMRLATPESDHPPAFDRTSSLLPSIEPAAGHDEPLHNTDTPQQPENHLPTPPPEPLSLQPANQAGTLEPPGSTVRFRDNVSIIDHDVPPAELADSPTRSSDSISSPQIFTPESSDEDSLGNDAADAAQDETEDVVANPGLQADIVDDPAEELDGTAALPQNPTVLDKLEAFFWLVDSVPDPDLHQDLPTPEGAEAPAEAPFAPVPNRGFAVLPEAPVEEPQPVPADVAAALEQNDPNALEDAEDLEGVLELIGMEGPLVGMVQNVVFSLLLISLTLAAAVWIPYIWGKIALILLANPVAVIFKAPVFLITHCVDLMADICFFVLGLLGIVFNVIAKTVKAATEPVIPSYAKLLDTETFEELAINVTHQSGSRLEKTLGEAVTIFSPDMPTFSMQSHRALITFKTSLVGMTSYISNVTTKAYTATFLAPWTISGVFSEVGKVLSRLPELPTYAATMVKDSAGGLTSIFRPQLKPLTLNTSSANDLALVEWSTQDKLIAVALGYVFFAVAGFLFMKLAHLFLGLKRNEKVEGPIADRLREAGGVMKVIVIIGIEMIVFPLYCGLLLDLALLPLFEGATVSTRLAFILRAPFTGLFLHWFGGTCYMFHFALFVSMCRKILRKGVLYFIRDPDDPTFHPVRDVLERPVPMQLGKIAFSALVYGGLVIMCLGGVVWSISWVSNVLPIRWITPEPRLAFPIDVVFFNFMVPFIVRKIKPSEKVAAAYEWWFRGIAHGLRLSHFLFNEEREDEKRPVINNGVLSWIRPKQQKQNSAAQEGIYVRAPASDSCRIPKNQKTFLEVTENNKRVDGAPDPRYGLHGRKNELFAKIWLPPQFRARIATFVLLLWMFAAGTGLACTLGPLVIGRRVIKLMSGIEEHVNDLYALTLGLHLLGAAAYIFTYADLVSSWGLRQTKAFLSKPVQALPQIWNAIRYVFGIAYLALAFGFVFPFTLSLITELYVHVPIFTFIVDREKLVTAAPDSSDAQILSAATTLTESASAGVHSKTIPPFPPTVFILQTWTLGLLYLRLILRVAMNYPCQHARHAAAIRSITHGRVWRPDVWLATRAVIIPLTLLCVTLLVAPLGYARFLITFGRLTDPEEITRAYRFAYPGLLGLVLVALAVWNMKTRLSHWRRLVRDEVYLVGERLHNYASHAVESRDKGKGKAREMSPPPGLIEEEEEEELPTTPREMVVPDALANDW